MKTTTHPSQQSLQALTVAVTAFPTWPQFAAAMDAGYCPTLRPDTSSRSKATRRYNAQVEELADRLERMGYQVWRG